MGNDTKLSVKEGKAISSLEAVATRANLGSKSFNQSIENSEIMNPEC